MTLNVDIHVIQSVPPSNLNRDDAGSPKTAVYGGVRRARVSSQAWKRATRRDMSRYLPRSELGTRTKRIIESICERVQVLDSAADTKATAARAADMLKTLGVKTETKRNADDSEPVTSALLFYSEGQLESLAQLLIECGDVSPKKSQLEDALMGQPSFDLALFGRMVASEGNKADLNVDAACQVAHALSTHAVTNEFDYYTAVDDQNPEEETGAGMIGTIEFNSATLYRYATVCVGALQKNLGSAEATGRAVEAFIRSFVESMPTGKQNTFANGTLPEAVVVMVRDGRAVNLAGAFEDAVSDRDGFVKASCQSLARYAREVDEAYAKPPVAVWVTRVGETTAALDALGGERVSLDILVSKVGELVRASTAESA